MPYWIAGIDVREKMLAVVVADVETDDDDVLALARAFTDRRQALEWSGVKASDANETPGG